MIRNEISTKEYHFKIDCDDIATAIWRIKEYGLLQVTVQDIKWYGSVFVPAKDTGQLEAQTANCNSYTEFLGYLWFFNSCEFLTDSRFWTKIKDRLAVSFFGSHLTYLTI